MLVHVKRASGGKIQPVREVSTRIYFISSKNKIKTTFGKMQSRQNILRLKVFTSKYSFKISVKFVNFLDIDNIPVLLFFCEGAYRI